MLLKKKKGCESPSTSEVCFLKTNRADIVNLLKKPEKNEQDISNFKPEKWGMREKATNNP
jgi:hypothetical protein